MIQIQEITKTYKTGSLVQRALDHLSLSLRDSEFVVILGQSGSGKTTLLNVIGGLDRSDSGELIINGVSTKTYKSRDWDAYRNHSVGFVFQSYNLIPHQSILSNVELALTIGGISRKERRRRAREALEKVGLSEHLHKKPSQLSGGQMQRVAIARALVNDPEILLADEPTGALDSETSVQVMDLLKEVAKDRLVVMVSHNAELAQQYATRIVRLLDGRIVSDSDPYEPPKTEVQHRKPGKAAMSFLTALMLSLHNLWTKKVRTVLVAFAGSIGIIGIAMILSMSNGANLYINSIEEETLKSYPLQITSSGMDFSSFLTRTRGEDPQPSDSTDQKEVREWNMITRMFSRVTENDLKSLRAYIETQDAGIYPNSQAVEYLYNVVPYVYLYRDGKVRQVNPDTSFSALGFSSSGGSMNSFMSAFASTDSFSQLPSEEEIYLSQYEVKAGRWPERYDECVLVLTQNGFVSDLTLYAMGVKDPNILDAIVQSFAQGKTYEERIERDSYSFGDFLGTEWKVISASQLYTYDKEFQSWTNHSDDEAFMKKLLSSAESLRIVGVVQAKEDANGALLNPGILYPASLTLHLMERSAQSEIVRAQLQNEDVNVLTGLPFGEQPDERDFDFSSLFTFDQEALENLFRYDPQSLSFDPSALDLSSIDFSSVNLSSYLNPNTLLQLFPQLTQQQLEELVSLIEFDVSSDSMQQLFEDIYRGYLDFSASDPSTDYAKLPQSALEYLRTQTASEILSDGISKAIEKNGEGLMTLEEMTASIEAVTGGFADYAQERGIGEDTDLSAYMRDYLASPAVSAKLSGVTEGIRARLAAAQLSDSQVQEIVSALYTGYQGYAQENGLPDPQYLGSSFSEYLNTPEAKERISGAVLETIDTSALEEKITEMTGEFSASIESRLSSMLSGAMQSAGQQISASLQSTMTEAAAQLQASLEEAFRFTPEDLSNVFSLSMTPSEMRDLFNSLLSGDTNATLASVLNRLGYAEAEDPYSIVIYPIDFNAKKAIKDSLERYNEAARIAGKEDQVIVYTDIVDTLMSSVTQIIDAISGVLIAFVAISLVVSSVMIGVITYISVLERKKEIGILRAIGASKRNVSNVFNAETIIIGALAGIFGIAITLLLLIPANYLIHSLTGETGINAVLPPQSAFILILLSIFLTLIGGLIPSRKAANSDPVAALRSE